MPKTLHLAPSFVLAGMLVAAPVLAAEAWDHRAMQSHHVAVDRIERPLAPGERRIGRVEIGVAASSSKVPDTLPGATQRQWEQRSSFVDTTPNASGPAPRIQGGRHEGTPGGVSHTSSSR